MPINNNRNDRPKGAAAGAAQPIRHLKLDAITEAFLERNLAQITSINQGINGALSYIIALNNLPGNWSLDWPNRQMICTDPEPAGPEPLPAPAADRTAGAAPAVHLVNGADPAEAT